MSYSTMTESQHQADFVKWMRHFHPQFTIYHIPNGEVRDGRTAYKLKNMGVLPGVFDLYVMEWRLYIEFKKSAREKLSKVQEGFKKVAEKSGHKTLVVYGFKDAVTKVKELYLDN